MVDGAVLAVSGMPNPNVEQILKYRTCGLLPMGLKSELDSLGIADQIEKKQIANGKKFIPRTVQINKSLQAVNKNIKKVNKKLARAKDPAKIKAFQEERKPFLEQRDSLIAEAKQIEEDKKAINETDPRILSAKGQIAKLNIHNQAVLDAMRFSDGEGAGELRNLITELDKLDRTGTAASSFVGVSYGAGTIQKHGNAAA